MVPRSSRLLALLALVVPLSGQTITTVAGKDWAFPASPLPAQTAPLGGAAAVAVDTTGNYYIADASNNIVVKVDSTGTLSIVAGNGVGGYSGDNGPATSASLQDPYGIAVDSSGNLYIADTGNLRVRKVSVGGIITTVAGNGTAGYSGDDGQAASAELNYPYGIAVNASALFIADANNAAVRQVSGGGIITTVAGGALGYSGDQGPATSAGLAMPSGLAFDGAGNLFIADTYNSVIRKVDITGTITTVAGNTTFGFSGDGGQAASAALNYPYSVAVDASGSLLIADWYNFRIRKVSAGGVITTIAGNGGYRYSGDSGPAVDAALQLPGAVVRDAAGNLFIFDTANQRVREVTTAGAINTIAGAGIPAYSGDNGPAAAAFLNHPAGGAIDSSGNLFIADSANNAIRKVTPEGTITTMTWGMGPNPGDNQPLRFPGGVAVDAAGDLFIADTFNSLIREVTANGVIMTVAGDGIPGYSGDGGPATSAQISYPAGVTVDTSGNLFIADSDNHAIRKVSAGTISTIAGNGTAGYWGDNGPAAGALLDFPTGVALDMSGNLFIADSNNNAIRKVNPGGIITTVAGTGDSGYSGDGGPATSATLNAPGGVAVDAACNLFIADTYNNRVRMVAGGGGVAVNPGTVILDATAQSGPALSVTSSGSGCGWASISQTAWIAVTSGATGIGNGTVGFTVQANSTGAVRTATLQIGGQTVSVTQRETTDVFSDVSPSDYFFDFADLMYQAGITGGCLANPPDFCPDSTTTRGQMAVFLIAAIEGGSSFTYPTSQYFTDVPSASPYFKFIQKLKDLGITAGCTTTAYCPNDPVTRGEMAAFIVRARYGNIQFGYPSTAYFTDVPSTYLFFPFIQKMAQSGITGGCAPSLFCPNTGLTRGQMAVFVVTGLLNEMLPAGTPYIGAAAPHSATPGQSITVALTGLNTHFSQGATQVIAAAGIATSSITVASATSLTVQVTLDAGVAPGPTSLVVMTDAEEAVLPNGFIVQ